MIDVNAAYRKVIQELTLMQSDEFRGRRLREGIPGLIAVNDEGGIVTSREIDAAIEQIGDWTRQQNPKFKGTHTVAEWRSAVRRAFGPALSTLDLDHDLEENTKALRAIIENGIRTDPIGVFCNEFVVGCQIFSRPLKSAFNIGPVLFEPPTVWLARKHSDHIISATIFRRMQKHLNGNQVRARKPSHDSITERAVMDVIGKAKVVCTVQTEGLGAAAAEQRGLSAARMALMSIALLWARPSRALEGMHLDCDAGPRKAILLVSRPNEPPRGSWRRIGLPIGTYMDPDQWEQHRSDNADYFDLTGRLANCWSSGGAYESANTLIQALAQAVFFFWEACRDENHLMSIVKFTAALEALAGGREAAIIDLLEVRLGVRRDEDIYPGTSLEQLVAQIYKHARSRTLHGNNPDIAYDWSDIRTRTEQLTRTCLMQCIGRTLEQPPIEDRADLRSRV